MMIRLIFGLVLVVQLVVGCGSDPVIEGTGGSSGAGGMGGTNVEPGATCLAFCANLIGTCSAIDPTFQTEDECGVACQGTIEDGRNTSEACADAYEAGFQCVADLECPDVFLWRDLQPNPCTSLSSAVEALCQ